MRIVRVQDVVLDESHFHWDNEDSLGIILYTELNSPTPGKFKTFNKLRIVSDRQLELDIGFIFLLGIDFEPPLARIIAQTLFL